jgi:hypothetical protein
MSITEKQFAAEDVKDFAKTTWKVFASEYTPQNELLRLECSLAGGYKVLLNGVPLLETSNVYKAVYAYHNYIEYAPSVVWISDEAARILLEGWFTMNNPSALCTKKEWADANMTKADPGESFDIGVCVLMSRHGGWYIRRYLY